MHVSDMGDYLLQQGTIYGAHRTSGGTIYDDTSGSGGPLVQGDQLQARRQGGFHVAWKPPPPSPTNRASIISIVQVRAR